ncbi:two-component sensor histidine kinase [Actinoplanes cyaneus]|uniref:histidine kinase n=1 Tax=Actinoplanes cyaneus TaxID=52696 RepID=A0A919M3V5_9ACTN|nr:histidine kinase [Actinoplanes cyaneus]MCW2137851.1 Signal transduction histidine kinase [Actinoplanes cyaneus]GID64942.1 two-component sensor histidine kinase [Actinoplanes cyaneus]
MGHVAFTWLLPAALSAEPDAPARRSTRDWVVDSLCFVIGFGFTVLATLDLLGSHPTLVQEWHPTQSWLVVTDAVLSGIAGIGLWWRRRFPLALGIYCVVLSTFSVAGAFTMFIALLTVAVHCRFVVLAAYVGVAVVANVIFPAVRPEGDSSPLVTVLWGVAIVVIIALWGMVIRARRELVVSLRDRAARAEAEQQLRVEQARALERNRIAREMHDVLAHRISMLSLHAGALEFRPGAPPEEIAGAAAVVRASAHQAMQDLRAVIGVLRAGPDNGDPTPEKPQPTLTALPALVEEARSAGDKVNLEVTADLPEVPAGVGRAAYRIVQEGLTNARKHAHGTIVQVRVGGACGAGLTIEVANPLPVASPGKSLPGTGLGLIGLTERATLAGGRLTHGPIDGEFRLVAHLPWPEP